MPTRDTAWPAGTPCWIDYTAAEPEQAKAFYADLLGWTYDEAEPDFGSYQTVRRNGSAVAGLMPVMEAHQPAAWTTYFATADTDATVARITTAGGTVVAAPMDVGSYGRMAVALDPQGNAFAIWQAGDNLGVELTGEPGSLVWTEAAVDDPEAARAFYTAVFGYAYDEIDGAEGYTTFGLSGPPFGGLGAHQPGSPKGWSTCFAVTSTDDAVATVERAGGKVTMSATDSPYGRYAVVEDPWGASFSVMQELPG